jgi:hypothetical protein
MLVFNAGERLLKRREEQPSIDSNLEHSEVLLASVCILIGSLYLIAFPVVWIDKGFGEAWVA